MYSHDETKYDYNLKNVLRRTLKCNIKFSNRRLPYKVAKVTFVGHIFSVFFLKYSRNIVIFKFTKQKTTNGISQFSVQNLSELSANRRELIFKNCHYLNCKTESIQSNASNESL